MRNHDGNRSVTIWLIEIVNVLEDRRVTLTEHPSVAGDLREFHVDRGWNETRRLTRSADAGTVWDVPAPGAKWVGGRFLVQVNCSSAQ